jgi:hypothetical protein
MIFLCLKHYEGEMEASGSITDDRGGKCIFFEGSNASRVINILHKREKETNDSSDITLRNSASLGSQIKTK